MMLYFPTTKVYSRSDGMTKEEEWTISYLRRRNADLESENERLRRKLDELAIIESHTRIDREQRTTA